MYMSSINERFTRTILSFQNVALQANTSLMRMHVYMCKHPYTHTQAAHANTHTSRTFVNEHIYTHLACMRRVCRILPIRMQRVCVSFEGKNVWNVLQNGFFLFFFLFFLQMRHVSRLRMGKHKLKNDFCTNSTCLRPPSLPLFRTRALARSRALSLSLTTRA